jgi:hypothetical protein
MMLLVRIVPGAGTLEAVAQGGNRDRFRNAVPTGVRMQAKFIRSSQCPLCPAFSLFVWRKIR